MCTGTKADFSQCITRAGIFLVAQIRPRHGTDNCNSLSKLNSNPYRYKLKFISTSKQKYNLKFQEFQNVKPSKYEKTTKFDQKKFSKLAIMRKQSSKTPSFFFFLSANYFLCRWLWVINTRKRRKGFWKVAFFFLSSFFGDFA